MQQFEQIMDLDALVRMLKPESGSPPQEIPETGRAAVNVDLNA